MKEPLWWYNNVRRHWINWRLRRMWRAAKIRPDIMPQAARIDKETERWALEAAKRLDPNEEKA